MDENNPQLPAHSRCDGWRPARAPADPRRGLMVPLIAHQGGWDEALLVAGPLLAIAALLWLAKRRADQLPPAGTPPERDPDPDTP